MRIAKYKKALMFYIVFIVFVLLVLLITEPWRGSIDISPLIPSEGFFETFLILCLLIPAAAIIGGAFFGYLLGPLLLVIHKKIFGANMTYGIQERPQSEKFKVVFKAFFPGLMAINFGILLTYSDELVQAALSGPILEGGSAISVIMAMIVFLWITMGVAMALFSPVWFLLDAGIVYSNKQRIEKRNPDQPIEVRSVGGWFIYLLKGYAGIAAVISFYQITVLFLGAMAEVGPVVLVVNMIVFIPLPILLAISCIPTFIILDITKEKRVNYIRNIAMKLGINQYLDVDVKLEKINQQTRSG